MIMIHSKELKEMINCVLLNNSRFAKKKKTTNVCCYLYEVILSVTTAIGVMTIKSKQGVSATSCFDNNFNGNDQRTKQEPWTHN